MAILLKQKIQRKGRSRPIDPHDCDSFGDILRRLRWEAEGLITPTFDRPLSLKLDFLMAAEGRDEED